MYKVVIPSAGKGTRLKDLSKHINKALVSVNQKPSISYVIEKFPENIEIIVPVGYKSQTIKDFLITAYPKRKFTFIKNLSSLERVTNILFSNKRKMINKNLKKLLSQNDIKKLKDVNLKSRPSEIEPNTYYKIVKIYEAQK